MYWNAIKVFTCPLECLSYVFWVICGWFERDLRCERSGWFSVNRRRREGWKSRQHWFRFQPLKISTSSSHVKSPRALAAQIALKSPKRHKKDNQVGKWTLLLHFSAYSGHCIISHTFFLCPPLTIDLPATRAARRFASPLVWIAPRWNACMQASACEETAQPNIFKAMQLQCGICPWR